jgi:hypothetical protein
MRKLLVIAAALATIASAFAVPALGQSRDSRAERPTANQLMAYDEARIARLKADLRLTSDQEGGWGKLDRTLRDISKARTDRMIASWGSEPGERTQPPTPVERMRRASDAMRVQADDLKSTADAVEPLWGVLNDQQKRTLSAYLDQSFGRPR